MARGCVVVLLVWVFLLGGVVSVGVADADARRRRRVQVKPMPKSVCFRELKRLGVKYRPGKGQGIQMPVQVHGRLGGILYKSYNKKPLVLDCSLVVSLAASGPALAQHGIDEVVYSSAYQRRSIAGSRRPSQHSFGLAIDVHEFVGKRLERRVTVRNDYEQGLGDDVNCIGAPLTKQGAMLKMIDCQLSLSGRFRFVLSPDYDAAHYNHFHIEALAWAKRTRASLRPRPQH